MTGVWLSYHHEHQSIVEIKTNKTFWERKNMKYNSNQALDIFWKILSQNHLQRL